MINLDQKSTVKNLTAIFIEFQATLADIQEATNNVTEALINNDFEKNQFNGSIFNIPANLERLSELASVMKFLGHNISTEE